MINDPLTIYKSAADVLTTECAHVWKPHDVSGEGLGTWLYDQIAPIASMLSKGSHEIDIAGGITLNIIKFGEGIEVVEAKYVPLNGVKVEKLASFGKSGVSYFINSSQPLKGKKTFSLTKVLYPSKETEVVAITQERAHKFIGLPNSKGMAQCEFELVSATKR